MKTRLKNLFIAALLAAPVIFFACSGNKTAGARDNSDSTDYRSIIRKLSFEDPDKAFALIDSLEDVKKHPTYISNYYRCMVHNNMGKNYRSIIHYGNLAMSDPRFKKENPEFFMHVLYAVSFAYYDQSHYSNSLKLVRELMDVATKNNNEEMQINSLELNAHNLMAIGEYDKGIQNCKESADRAIKYFNETPTYRSFDKSIVACSNYLIYLKHLEMYSEVEKYIQKVLHILKKGKNIKFPSDEYYDKIVWNAYTIFMEIYYYTGNKKEAEKYRILSEATHTAKLPENRMLYLNYNLEQKNFKQAWSDIEYLKKYFVEKRDTISSDYCSYVLTSQLLYFDAIKDYKRAFKSANDIIICKDSIYNRKDMENAAELAKIYETQEKEKQIAEQKAELTKHKNILIAVVVLLVIGVTFIVIVLRFNRRVNRRNKTIVATINQMMQKDDQLTRLQLSDDNSKADNIDPEEIRLKQSIEMLKDDKPIDEIVTECGYRDANDYGKKFYDHFGIHVEDYRKWSKNMNKQEKTGIEEAKQMKQSFIRNMSHEIRTPLNQIYGFVQLLTTPGIQLSDEQKQKFTGIIGEQTSHMTQMLNTFLEMSQYESNSEPLPVDTVDIGELLTMSCSSFQNIKDGVELSAKNNSGLVTLKCNQKGLLRILHCIIDNAVKFTDKGLVSVECASYAEGNIVFSVTDTGKGIPEGDEERIFEQFYKVDEFIPGTGLGLSLARVIADRMGASIAVDRSYKAQGSRFNIVLKS